MTQYKIGDRVTWKRSVIENNYGGYSINCIQGDLFTVSEIKSDDKIVINTLDVITPILTVMVKHLEKVDN